MRNRVWGFGAVVALLALLAGGRVEAQTLVRLQPVFATAVVDSTADSITVQADRLGAFGAVKIQTLDSYTGTWEVRCAVDGVTFDTAAMRLQYINTSTTDTSVSNVVGIWNVVDASACRAIKVVPTAGFSGTDTTFYVSASQVGGGGSSGSVEVSGGSVSVDNLSADATADVAALTTGPQMMGYGSDAEPTGISADGDAARLWVDQMGRAVTVYGGGPSTWVNGRSAVTDGSSTSTVAAQGSGVRFCATTLVVSNSSATAVTVDIRDGTAGSVLMTIPASANMGGAVIPLPVPLCTSANTALAQDPSASATTIAVTAVGFKATF